MALRKVFNKIIDGMTFMFLLSAGPIIGPISAAWFLGEKQRSVCPDCGKRIPVHANFCPACGYPDPATCGACGRKDYSLPRFCSYCGHDRYLDKPEPPTIKPDAWSA